MNSNRKQLLMLLIAIMLFFYRPSSVFEVVVGLGVALVLLGMAFSSIREHRKNKKNL